MARACHVAVALAVGGCSGSEISELGARRTPRMPNYRRIVR